MYFAGTLFTTIGNIQHFFKNHMSEIICEDWVNAKKGILYFVEDIMVYLRVRWYGMWDNSWKDLHCHLFVYWNPHYAHNSQWSGWVSSFNLLTNWQLIRFILSKMKRATIMKLYIYLLRKTVETSNMTSKYNFTKRLSLLTLQLQLVYQ